LQLDKRGNIPLFWAVLNGHYNIIRVLLKYGGVNQTNYIGDSSLHYAIKRGQMDIITELVSNGAVVDVQNNEGYTPLHLAVIEGDSKMVEYLLNSGARADIKTIDGFTPIHLSTLTNTEILQIIVKESVHYLFSQDEFGDTVVHWAVRENDEQLLKRLFQLGAPFQMYNFDQESPISLAKTLNHHSLIPLLSQSDNQEESGPYISLPSAKCPRLDNNQTDPHWFRNLDLKSSELETLRDNEMSHSYYDWCLPIEDRYSLAIG